jgi:2-octaprenyl-6-methoxyphenol hydroxylase
MTTPPLTPAAPLRLAVVGAGPAGLALALLAARALPRWQVWLYDARALAADVGADPRTLALSLGSVQLLRRLGAWPAAAAQPIAEVHVSQVPPGWPPGWPPALAGRFGGDAAVRIRAVDEAVPMLGAVLAYGALVAPLQSAWLDAARADPQRLASCYGHAVRAIRPLADGAVEVDAGVVERHAAVVVAEGGVFAQQARKALAHDYRQTAWVGSATLAGPPAAVAYERFTRAGPLALLPLPPASAAGPGAPRAALVWCVGNADDPVRELGDAQRMAVINNLLPAAAPRLRALSPLKSFALGLNAETTLVRQRTVRIGNAAQTLHPVAGQGLNLGLRDAYTLVQALREVGSAADIDRALARVEWARAPDRWGTIVATDFLARSFTWTWPGVAAARGLALAALEAAGPLKSLLARQMMYGRR